MNVFIYIKIC